MKSLQVCQAIPLLNGKTDQDLEHHGPRGPEVTALEVKVMSWRRKDLRHIYGCSMQLHIAPFFALELLFTGTLVKQFYWSFTSFTGKKLQP